MRTLLALLMAASMAPRLSAQMYTFTSHDNGAKTLFTYNLTGTVYATTGISYKSSLAPGGFGYGSSRSTAPFLRNTFAQPVYFRGVISGLYLEDINASVSKLMPDFEINTLDGGAADYFGFWRDQTTTGPDAFIIPANNPWRVTGNINDSVVLDFAFSNFIQGSYWNGNVVVIGTPVPEPSTYGLVLGGLALAGAVIRRRRRKQAA